MMISGVTKYICCCLVMLVVWLFTCMLEFVMHMKPCGTFVMHSCLTFHDSVVVWLFNKFGFSFTVLVNYFMCSITYSSKMGAIFFYERRINNGFYSTTPNFLWEENIILIKLCFNYILSILSRDPTIEERIYVLHTIILLKNGSLGIPRLLILMRSLLKSEQ